MPGSGNRSSGGHTGLLAFVMFVLLGGTVLLAWWLVEVRAKPVRRGERILREIRNRTLQAYWGSEPSTYWYLAADAGGKPIGWWRRSVEPTSEGIRGVVVRFLETRRFALEEWELLADASAGEYNAASEYKVPGGTVMRVDTIIQLRQGQIGVIRQTKGRQEVGQSRAPDNYIPEGMTSLVIRQAAKGDKPAAFRIILNDIAIYGGKVRFILMRVIPGEGDRISVKYEVGRHEVARTYQLNSEGLIAEITNDRDGTSDRLVSAEEVIRHFPEAAKFMPAASQPAPLPPIQEDPTALQAVGSAGASPRRAG